MIDRLTNEVIELLQEMIRNKCVNDGTINSGNESRNAGLLQRELEQTPADIEMFEPVTDRASVIARLPGTDPTAKKLCLMGHTDVVPVSEEGWRHDPFGGELIDGEIWGRGAVDMLNLTASMMVVFRHLAQSNKRYPGDIIYFGVADEEAGGTHGAKILVDEQWDHLACDYVLTEYGGTPVGTADNRSVLISTAEKGVAWRKIIVHGKPGHGSMPFQADNALVAAAEVVRRLTRYRPAPQLDEMWRARVKALDIGQPLTSQLLDPGYIQDALLRLPTASAANAHACSHTTFSPNVISGGTKTNTIPDRVVIEVDVRTLPGETEVEVNQHLRNALGDLFNSVTVEVLQNEESTSSKTDNSLWRALTSSVQNAYPGASVVPSIVTGGTDARFFRRKGVVAYGAGLLSEQVTAEDFLQRFHGHNERIDIESLRLTTQLWLDVIDRLWEIE